VTIYFLPLHPIFSRYIPLCHVIYCMYQVQEHDDNNIHKDFKLRKKNFLYQLHFFLVYQVLASIQLKLELDRNVQVV